MLAAVGLVLFPAMGSKTEFSAGGNGADGGGVWTGFTGLTGLDSEKCGLRIRDGPRR